ncbi:MAG: stage III sporulation protein AE [Clostridia bacterium]|nr:stage III sporulation protein AE [Clostridia bacterium]
MKKVALFIIIIALALLPFQGAVAFAETQEEEQEAAKKIGQEVDNRINELNLNAFEAFFLRLEDEYLKSLGSGIKDIIKNIIDGKTKLDLATVFNSIIKMLISSVLKVLPLMIMIIIIAILYGVFSGLTSGFSKASTNQIIYIVCYGAIITILGYAVADAVVSVKKTVSDMDTLMGYCFPVLLTLTSALGGVGSAGIYQPLMTVMTTVMIKVINVFILPMFIASVVFGIVGNLSDSIKLEKLNKTTKSIAEWTLGIIFSLFITFITAQGITGTAFDTVTIKSAKFALSSYVPILGGYLSEGFDLVLASCVVIKNALGLCSIIVLFFIALAPLVKIIALIFALRIASAIVEPISDPRISNMLYSTSKNLVTLVAIVAGFAFLFFIMVMLIITTCNFGVI